ncbi:MAG: hypothetical protein ACRYFS_15520 [Janthinobacterium lividum]
MNEQEQIIAFESIARELIKSHPEECASITPEAVAAIRAWTSPPATLTPCEELVRDLLRADGLLNFPLSPEELLHRAERTEF